MRIRAALAISAFVAANSFAVVPQFWRVRTPEEFLAGDIDGFAVTSRGELRPGPSLKKRANSPVVISGMVISAFSPPPRCAAQA